MKSKILLLTIISCLVFTSCKNILNVLFPENETEKNNSGTSPEVPSGESSVVTSVFFKTLASNENSIIFDTAYEGKKCYLICSNESAQNVNNSNVGIQFNQNNSDSSRSASGQDMIILKNTVRFSDGYWRAEIQFNKPDLEISESRATASNSGTSSARYRDLNDTKFFAQTGADSVTQ